MCDPVTIAITSLNVMSSIQEHRSLQAVAAAKQRANEQTRRNSDQSYLYDISKIDKEAVSASREKALANFKDTQDANKKLAQNLNLNAGNPDKIIQDIAGTHDMAFLDVTRDYETDISRLYGKTKEAYSAQQRRYNSIAPVVMPSRTGLFLNVATAAAKGYQAHTAATGSAINYDGATSMAEYQSNPTGYSGSR
jgi:hypothetical protein